MSSQNIFKAQLPFKQPNHFWTQIFCSLSDAGESFPQQRQQRWQKTFVDAAAAVAVAAAWLEACFLCSPVCLPRRCTCSASHFPPAPPPPQSANSSYRTPARRVKCAAASEQLRFDGFAARNENAASRVGDQATSKAGVHAQKLFTPFALCLWHI